MLKEKVFLFNLAMFVFLPFFTMAETTGANNVKEASVSGLFETLVNRIDARRKEANYQAYFENLQKKQGFNGVVLIANNHSVVYQGAFGYSDLHSKTDLVIDDQFQLASVSKQFTAVAVMLLKERNYLDYDDKVTRFISDFPYPDITIRHLLTHRSGLAEYRWFLEKAMEDKHAAISNTDLISKMASLKPGLNFTPGNRFLYSNTGYAVLASIVEKISGTTFSEFMQKVVFQPLGMNNTRIYSKCKSSQMPGRVTGYERNGRLKAENDCFNGITGDKNVFSTVNDLFIWDQALYSDKLISQTTLSEAFKEGSPKRRNNKNYGFGWRLNYENPEKKIVYHGGWWHGFRTYFMRNISDGNTLIVLSNKVNHSINSLHDIKEEVAGLV
ncbi:MAG: serine hydrolase domain-containing protein [Bacteroidia bacterium]